jgi:hypothetical protein
MDSESSGSNVVADVAHELQRRLGPEHEWLPYRLQLDDLRDR